MRVPLISNKSLRRKSCTTLTTVSAQCFYCRQKLSSQCERTNKNTLEHKMYGGPTAGFFGYAHFTGGFAGGQAEYVRVPFGDVNTLKIPDDVPDEKGRCPTC